MSEAPSEWQNIADEFELNAEPAKGNGQPASGQTVVTAEAMRAKLLTRSMLETLPDPEPLIDNVLDKGTTVLLYGYWGTFKSFIALDWAACVATGKPWQGRETEQGKVLYVVGEGAFGFKGRTNAWEVAWQRMIDDDRFHVYPKPVNLLESSDVDALCYLIATEGYVLVVLDTLARCTIGGDENSSGDGGIVVDALTKIVAATPNGRGVAVGVHHTGKDRKTLRGSSALDSGADTAYFTSRDEGGPVTLERMKRKDGPQLDTHLLAFDPIEGTPSGVLKAAHAASHGGWDGDLLGEGSAKFRRIFTSHFGHTGANRAALRDVLVEEGGMSRATVYRTIDKQVECGWLYNTSTERTPFYVHYDDES